MLHLHQYFSAPDNIRMQYYQEMFKVNGCDYRYFDTSFGASPPKFLASTDIDFFCQLFKVNKAFVEAYVKEFLEESKFDSASIVFCNTVRCGRRANFWNTIDIFVCRRARSRAPS